MFTGKFLHIAQIDDAAMAALDDLLEWIAEDGDVAIYDATNSTRSTNSTEPRSFLTRSSCSRNWVAAGDLPMVANEGADFLLDGTCASAEPTVESNFCSAIGFSRKP